MSIEKEVKVISMEVSTFFYGFRCFSENLYFRGNYFTLCKEEEEGE